jgi:hypothetical protein
VENVFGFGIDLGGIAQGHFFVETKRSDDHESELLTGGESGVVCRSHEVVVVITDDTATFVTTVGT